MANEAGEKTAVSLILPPAVRSAPHMRNTRTAHQTYACMKDEISSIKKKQEKGKNVQKA